MNMSLLQASLFSEGIWNMIQDRPTFIFPLRYYNTCLSITEHFKIPLVHQNFDLPSTILLCNTLEFFDDHIIQQKNEI